MNRGPARRYAEAIFELARDRGDFDLWLRELRQASALFQDARLRTALTSPALGRDEKLRILDAQLPGLSAQAHNLLRLLVARERLGRLPDILEEFQRLVDRHRGVERAEVVTAVPIGEREQHLLAQRLSQFTGKHVVIRTRVDPSIMGGVIARVGDTLIDGSVRGRLEALRRRLVTR